MTKKEQMKELRDQGMTYKEIGAALGTSHQYVGFVLGKAGCGGGWRPYTAKQCQYDGLRNWLNEKKISRRELCRILQKGASHGGSVSCTLDHLSGRHGEFTISDVNHLIDASGMTYEQLFRSESGA